MIKRQITDYKAHYLVELAVVSTWPPLQICGSPVEIRATVQIQGPFAIAKGRQVVKPSTSNANCKITQQEQEENCKSESQAMSTIIWYSWFTITIRNIIVIIPWQAIVQMISSCTHICNMQIVHLAYHHNVLTVTFKSSHLVFNPNVTIPALCKVSTIQLSCINHYSLRA